MSPVLWVSCSRSYGCVPVSRPGIIIESNSRRRGNRGIGAARATAGAGAFIRELESKILGAGSQISVTDVEEETQAEWQWKIPTGLLKMVVSV